MRERWTEFREFVAARSPALMRTALPETEVAILGVSVGTVKSQAARALARPRESPGLLALMREGSR